MSEADIVWAAIIIFLVSFSGVVFNILGMLVVVRSPLLHNAFGALCFSHMIANFGVLFVFVAWVTPTTILQYDKTEETFGKILGQINILFWNACCYSHLAISLNRFLSISMPTKIKTLFTNRNTVCLICIVWLLAIGHVIPYFWRDQCFTAYDPTSWTWIFADTACGRIITTYTDYYTSVGIFIVMSTFDVLTFIMLVSYNKKAHHSSDEMRKRRKVEIRFFVQSTIQGLLFFYEVFNFYYVVTFFTNQWLIFMTSTFAWEICHCLDGLVVVVFHFKRAFIQRNGSSAVNTKVVSKLSEIKPMRK